MTDSILGNTSITKYDAIVIGSGAGGGPVAHLLAAAGQKVLVLEAGPNWFDGLDKPGAVVPRFSNDELKFHARSFVVPNKRVEPRTFRQSEADGDRKMIGDVNSLAKTVGGGAAHADLKMPRFAPDDFKMKSLLGDVANATFADWPVLYDELEPYYLYGERALGVQGVGGSSSLEGPRSGAYPMPFGNEMYATKKIAAGAAKLGFAVSPYPAALNSKPYDGRPPCTDCGFCSDYGCPTSARGTPAVTVLRKALLSGNCTLHAQTRAVRLVMNGAKTEVTGVECILPDGKRQVFTADRYVLAASPIEDARLLFLSDPAGIGNSSGLVGRNLMFHLHTSALALFDERLHSHRGRTVTHFMDFRGKAKDPKRPLGGIVEISSSSGLLFEAATYARAMKLLGGYDGRKMLRLMDQSPFRDRAVALAMVGEDAPQLTNRVDLDPAVKDYDGIPVARVTYKNHAFELAARDYYAPKLLDVLQAAGARFVGPAPEDDGAPGTAHIMGTLRSGTDPKTSVTDANGRFHDVGNLYASDGSLFPTSSGYNPTMTIVALALRVGAAMVNAASPLSALPAPPAA